MTEPEKAELRALEAELPQLLLSGDESSRGRLRQYQALRTIQEHEAYAQTGSCSHAIVNGDNYGESCATCGERLRGYGFQATHADCRHAFQPDPLEPGLQLCIFCQRQQLPSDPP